MSSSRRRRRHFSDSGENTSQSRKEGQASRKAKETGDRLRREHFLKPDSDQIDLNVLLDAVLDINDKLRKQEQKNCNGYGKSDGDFDSPCSTRTSAKGKEGRILQKKSNPSSRSERQNFSFRNDQVYDIDRENQRLLREITHRRVRSATTRDRKSHKSVNEPFRLLASSEVNRRRFQKKIDEENQALLRRLEAAKPSQSLNRDYLINSRNAHPSNRGRPSSATRPCSSRRLAPRSRTLSESHLSTSGDGGSQKSFSFASSRKSLARKGFRKPAWEAGW